MFQPNKRPRPRARARARDRESRASVYLYMKPTYGYLFNLLRLIASWSRYQLKYSKYKKIALAQQRKTTGSKSGKKAIVLGNGPSVNKLRPEHILAIKNSVDLEIFVLNDFPRSNLANILEPTYLVLSDPEHHPEIDSLRNENIWNWVKSNSSTNFVIPLDWFCTMSKYEFKNTIYYFDDSSLAGISRRTSPLYPRGYMSFTFLKALSQAKHFGFESIGILGIDNTMFETISVDRNLKLQQEMNHFMDYGDSQSYEHFYPNGIGDYFIDVALGFYEAHKFTSKNTFNLNVDGLFDAFPKKDLNEYLST